MQLAGHLRGKALQEWNLIRENEKKSTVCILELEYEVFPLLSLLRDLQSRVQTQMKIQFAW